MYGPLVQKGAKHVMSDLQCDGNSREHNSNYKFRKRRTEDNDSPTVAKE